LQRVDSPERRAFFNSFFNHLNKQLSIMETSKIKSIAFDHTWQWKGESNHDYQIEMENGDKGEITAKTIDKYAVGDELIYTQEEKNGRNKIKAASKGGYSGGGGFKGGYQKESFEEKSIGFAYSYAKDLVVAGKLTVEQLVPAADRLHGAMVQRKKEVSNGSQ
jgi:hypothetical protein